MGPAITLNAPLDGCCALVAIGAFANLPGLATNDMLLGVQMDGGTVQIVMATGDSRTLSGTAIFANIAKGDHAFKLKARKTGGVTNFMITATAIRPAYIRGAMIGA